MNKINKQGIVPPSPPTRQGEEEVVPPPLPFKEHCNNNNCWEMAAVHQAMLLSKKCCKNARADKSVNICRQPSNVVTSICITFIYHFSTLYLQTVTRICELTNQ